MRCAIDWFFATVANIDLWHSSVNKSRTLWGTLQFLARLLRSLARWGWWFGWKSCWPSAGSIMSLYPSILSGSCYHFSKICQVPIGACQMEELTRQRQVKDWSQCFDDYGSIDEKEKDKDVRRSHGSESQVPDTELFTKRLRVFICQKLMRENTSSLLLFSSDHDDTTITFSTLDWDSVQHYIETTKNVRCRTLHPLMTESRIHELERDFLLWVIIQRHRHRHCRLALRWNVIRFSLRIPNVRIWRMIFFRR